MDQKTAGLDLEKTSQLKDILNESGADYLNKGDWLIFESDLGTLFLRKSRHKVIDSEDGESSTVFTTTPSGENLPPILYACDENFRAS